MLINPSAILFPNPVCTKPNEIKNEIKINHVIGEIKPLKASLKVNDLVSIEAVIPINEAAAMGNIEDIINKIVPIKIANICHAWAVNPCGIGER